MTTPISETAGTPSTHTALRLGPAPVQRALPVVAAVVVAILLAAGYAQRAWAQAPDAASPSGPWGLAWSQIVLVVALVAGVVSTLVLGWMTVTARGGRAVSAAAIGVPLATGLAAAGVPSALLGLVGVGIALHWLGVEF